MSHWFRQNQNNQHVSFDAKYINANSQEDYEKSGFILLHTPPFYSSFMYVCVLN